MAEKKVKQIDKAMVEKKSKQIDSYRIVPVKPLCLRPFK